MTMEETPAQKAKHIADKRESEFNHHLAGVLVIIAALFFLAQGSRRVSATRTALFSILDTPLGPLWMWLGFGELPSTACFIGGSNAYCSIVCKKETAATDCPTPLTSGVCNKHGYCKKP